MTEEHPFTVVMKDKPKHSYRGGMSTVHYSCSVWASLKAVGMPSWDVVNEAPDGVSIIGEWVLHKRRTLW